MPSVRFHIVLINFDSDNGIVRNKKNPNVSYTRNFKLFLHTNTCDKVKLFYVMQSRSELEVSIVLDTVSSFAGVGHGSWRSSQLDLL